MSRLVIFMCIVALVSADLSMFPLSVFAGHALFDCVYTIRRTGANLGSTTSSPQIPRKKDQELELGIPIERSLSGGEIHSYRITLTSGQYVHVIVDQRGIDVVVRVTGPQGQLIAEVDSPNGTEGPEPVSLIAETSGFYFLEVRSLDQQAAPGHYEIRIGEQREAIPTDKSRIAAEKLVTEAEQLEAEAKAASLRKAIEKYEESLPHWRAIGDGQKESDVLIAIGYLYSSLNEHQNALQSLSPALMLKRALNDRLGEAEALNNMGLAHQSLDNLKSALECYNQALPLFQAANDRHGEALVLNNIGGVYDMLGEMQKALDSYQLGLKLRRAIGDLTGEAQTLVNIGVVNDKLGELQESLELYHQALSLFERTGSQLGKAHVLVNIGSAYSALGEKQKALDYFAKTLKLWRAVADHRMEAITLLNIGAAYNGMGDPKTALKYYNQALPLHRAVSNREGEAKTLEYIGLAYNNLGKPQKALEYLSQVLVLRREREQRQREADTLRFLGGVYRSLGQPQKALELYRESLEICRVVGDRSGEAFTLLRIARVKREQGSLAEARPQIESALAIIESYRTRVSSYDLRASYLATKKSFYEFHTDLLMKLNRRYPDAGYDVAALQASERARARSLLEMLGEARLDIRQGVDPTLLESERTLQQQLNAKEQARMRLMSGKHTPKQAAAAEKELSELLQQYEDNKAQIKAKSPRYAALTQPQPLGLKEIQQEVLDSDTLLLEYALGDERSYLWAVTPSSITSYELPKRETVETVARRVYDLITTAQTARGQSAKQLEAQYWQQATRLSQMLLGPVTPQLEDRRLLIVADGALQYIPFGALPAPRPKTQDSRPRTSAISNQRPLIVDHEIVSLPSASVLAVMRREIAGRTSPPNTVAVLADPVFEKDDPRIKSGVRGQNTSVQRQSRSSNPQIRTPNPEARTPNFDLSRALRDVRLTRTGLNLPRLYSSREEAEAILAAAPAGESLKALDFQASRQTATTSDLNQYRIVHFATHGMLDNEHPELSGIVLSLFDEQGEPKNGFLRLHDIYNLHLPADLVVLSACNTALGKEIKGEGIVGLTRGFMYAGAARVVASLWKVEDTATAELMTRFYQKMLKEGARPAAALRAAQVEMWKRKRWKASWNWAAFVLQGEWR